MTYDTKPLPSNHHESVQRLILLIAACVTVVVQPRQTLAATLPRIYVMDSEVTAAGDRRVVDVDRPATLTCTHAKNITWSFVNVNDEVVPVDQEIVNYSDENQLYTATVDIRGSSSSAVGQYRCTAQDDSTCRHHQNPQSDERCMLVVSSVYIFMKGSTVSPLVRSKRWRGRKNVMMSRETDRPYTLPCKPSNPAVMVKLENNMHEVVFTRPLLRTGFIIPANVTVKKLECVGSYEGHSVTLKFNIASYSTAAVPPPTLDVIGVRQRNSLGGNTLNYDVVEGSNVTVNCSRGKTGFVARIVPRFPSTPSTTTSREGNWRLLRILNLTQSGEVDCYITNRYVNSSTVTATLTVIGPDQHYLQLGSVLKQDEGTNRQSWRLNFRAHSTPCITWTKVGDPDEVLLQTSANSGEHCSVTRRHCITILPVRGEVEKVMLSSTKQAVGAYSVTASVGDLNKTVVFNYSKHFEPQDAKISLLFANTKVRLDAPVRVQCSAAGFPRPVITLLSTPCGECDLNTTFALINSTVQDNCNSTKLHCKFLVESKTVFYVSFLYSTSIFCSAANVLGNRSSEELNVKVYDTPTDVLDSLVIELREDSVNYIGFGQQASNTAFSGDKQHYHDASVVEGSNISLQCRAQRQGGQTGVLLLQRSSQTGCHETPPSLCTNLTTALDAKTTTTSVSKVSAVTVFNIQKEACRCWVCTNSATQETVRLLLNVNKSISPQFSNASWQQPSTLDVEDGNTMILQCPVDGLPVPTITWLKDGKNLADSTDERFNISRDTLSIVHSKYADGGLYTCQATNRKGSVHRTVQVTVLSGLAKASTMLLSVVAVVSVMLALVSTMVFYRIIQDRKKRRELRREEQELFQATNGELLDPDLSPQEQVDLLPYKPSYNIDRDCLIFERQLGVGAFGRVYQAQLITRVPGEVPVTVAVKTIKSKTNNEHVRAFRSEIKILMYLGRHRNIINLIGVCCKDMVDKGEMLMVVEYCRHKSLLDYMRTNRRDFERQTSGGSDGVAMSPGSSTVYWPAGTVYQNTGTIGTLAYPSSSPGPSSPLMLKPSLNMLASVTGRSVSDLTKARLFDWTLQVANGMAFLAGKKIIHGDLATRNILLTEDNVIKVADFGLSKDVYNKVDNIYKLDNNRVLAIKWTALETLKFSELTCASDVWAFGVVMWEIFSLGANPYSEVENLMHFLEAGLRLQKPQHSSDLMYGVMLQCWHEDPTSRPTFEVLEHTLRNFNLISENQGEINPSFQSSGWTYPSGSFSLPYAGLDHSTTTTYLPMSPPVEQPLTEIPADVRSTVLGKNPSISSPTSAKQTRTTVDGSKTELDESLINNIDVNGKNRPLPSTEIQSQFDSQTNNHLIGSKISSEPEAVSSSNSKYVLHSQSGLLRDEKTKSRAKQEDNIFLPMKPAQLQNNPEYVLLSATEART